MPTNAGTLQSLQGKILFKSNRDGRVAIYVMDADGGNVERFNQETLYEQAAGLESFSPSRTEQVIIQRFGAGQYLFLRELGTEIKQQLTGGPWSYYAPAWGPDGKQIAYVAEIEGKPFVNLVNLDDGKTSVVLPPSVGVTSHPSWSPNGGQLAMTVQSGEHRQIWVADSNGANPRNLSNDAYDNWDPIWIKAFSSDTVDSPLADPAEQIGLGWSVDQCLVRVEAVDRQNGATPIQRVQILTNAGTNFDSGPISVRDFRETIVLNLPPGTHRVEVRVWNADYYQAQPLILQDILFCLAETATPTAMPTPTAYVVEPTAEPANVFEAATRVAQGERPRTGVLPIGAMIATNTPQPVVITNTPTPETTETREFQAALSTAIAVTTGTPTPLPPWWVTATPTPTDTPTPFPTSTPVSVPWAPRGTLFETPQPTPTQPVPPTLTGKILFQSDRDGRTEFYAMNPDGSDIQKLTAEWPYEQAIDTDVLSGDGNYRVFVRRDTRSFQIFFHDAQFNADVWLTKLGAGDAWDPAIDLSGWQVAFVSNEPGNDELYVINRDGSGLRRLTQNEWEWDRHPSWSPDGSEIVFWSNRDGRKQLYIVAPDGSNLRRISDGFGNDWDPVWVK
ncbi:MAG: hypothetical protein R2856_34410 [Caldilineaceae bacterium]